MGKGASRVRRDRFPQVDKTGRLVHTSNIKVKCDATTGLPGQPYTYYSIYARE